jgi:VCBS repeat-containing protein
MMKLIIALTGALVVGGLTGCGTSDDPKQEDVGQETSGTADTNQTEKGIVAGSMEPSLIEQDAKNGQAVYEFKIKNQTEKEKTFVFSSGQKIDFTLKDKDGNVVYRESENKMYTQAIQEIPLKQGEEFTQQLVLPKLDSGTYTLTVWLTAKGENDYKVEKDILIP